MYSKHCNIVLASGGDEIISLKLHHLPIEGMIIKFKPLSTGVEVEYKVEEVSLVMEEVTTSYPGPPADSSDGWEHEWLVEVSEVI
jgi:hypothetical protein